MTKEEAEDLIKKIKQLEPLNIKNCPSWVLNVIKHSSDGDRRKRGKWITTEYGSKRSDDNDWPVFSHECSECHYTFYDVNLIPPDCNFCTQCGAIMEKLYKCDPSKNKECRKTGCFINGGSCCLTTNERYAE